MPDSLDETEEFSEEVAAQPERPVVAPRSEKPEPAESGLRYPGSPKPTSVMVDRERSYAAWVGPVDRIHRIGRIVDECLRRAFEDARPENERMHEWELRSFAPVAEVISTGSIQRKGDLSAILAEVDAGDVAGVAIQNSREQARIYVRIQRDEPWRPVAKVRVSGSDPQWVAGTFEQLVNEVSKGVPRWVWLLERGQIVFSLAFALTAWAVWTGLTWGWDASYQILGVGVSFMSGWLGAGAHAALRRWVLIPFEVFAPGEKSTARKRGGAVGWTLGLISSILAIAAFVATVVNALGGAPSP